MQYEVLTILLADIKELTLENRPHYPSSKQEKLNRYNEFLRPAIEKRGGSLAKIIDDSFLATFEHPGDALDAAVALQQTIRVYSRTNPQKIHLTARVAIHTGKVITHESEIYYEAVKVVSNIREVIEPGEICFTESTYAALSENEIPPVTKKSLPIKGTQKKIPVYKILEAAASEQGSSRHLTGLRPASFGTRALAFILDFGIVGLLTFLMVSPAFSTLAEKKENLASQKVHLLQKLHEWPEPAPFTQGGTTSLPDSGPRMLSGEDGKQIQADKERLLSLEKQLAIDKSNLEKEFEKWQEKAFRVEATPKEVQAARDRLQELYHRDTLLERRKLSLKLSWETLGTKEYRLEKRFEGKNRPKPEPEPKIKPMKARPETLLESSQKLPEGTPFASEILKVRAQISALRDEKIYFRWQVTVTALLLFLIYSALWVITENRSIGKTVFRLQVCGIKGQPVNRAKNFYRCILYLISACPAGLGFLWAGFDPSHQTWHDKIAGTRVVRREMVRPEPQPSPDLIFSDETVEKFS